jgi:transcriptional regulator with XRE-family HTH domain
MLNKARGDEMNAVSKNIKRLRKRDNVSQEILAEKLNMTRQAVSNWETGKTQPDIDTLLSIAAAFHVDVTELIYGEKQNPEVYPQDKKKRMQIVCVLGAVFVLFLLTEIILVPYWKALLRTYYIAMPIWIYQFFIRPICYINIHLLFFSALSLRFDIRIANTAHRRAILYIGFILMGLYCLIFLNFFLGLVHLPFSLTDILLSLATNPAFFIIPGTALFFGLNK